MLQWLKTRIRADDRTAGTPLPPAASPPVLLLDLVPEPEPEPEPVIAAAPVAPDLPDAPGAPGSYWRDALGRVRRVPSIGPGPRRAQNPHEAVLRFAAWLREGEFAGWHTAEDIVEFYQWHCEAEGLEELQHDLLRERFASAPGVTRERRRLASATAPELVRIRRRMGGADRAMLYRVASAEEMAEAAEKAAEVAARRTKGGKAKAKAVRAASGDAPLLRAA